MFEYTLAHIYLTKFFIMNTSLLFKLYAIHSPSGNEKKMRRFLKRQVSECGATYTQDVHGNLFITKGTSDTYPCLAAHMDQVQRNHSKDFRVISGSGVCFGYSPKSHEQQGLGADDKNGIFVCLECLKKYDVLKVAFFVGEEAGCIGSSAADLEFFRDCRFIIQPDRKGAHDLITSMFCGEVCSEKFIADIEAERFGYRPAEGSVTDVGELVSRDVGISCLNLSCGYYEAHTDHEFTVLSELDNCLQFVCDIIENVTDTYPFEYVPLSWGTKKSGRYSYYNRYEIDEAYDYDYDEMYDILSRCPDITFEEVMERYCMSFWSYSDSHLRGIYDDCKHMIDADREKEKRKQWWQDDDDLPAIG